MSNNAQIEPYPYAVSAYSELITVQPSFRAQITGQYGFVPSVFRVTLGGTVEVIESMFEVSTGVSSTGVSAISTSEQVSVKAGQGLAGKLSTIFGTPAADNTQLGGLQTSGSLIGFGYDGLDFGIGMADGGELEIYELLLTVRALAAENATITINGTPYVVPLTNTSIDQNAYEIAVSLSAQVPAFNFSSNGSTVTTLALLPEIGGGSYTFTSGTATGTFTLIEANVLPVERWTKKANWNVDPDFVINPQMGNEYKVSYPYLGFGNTKFYIKERDTGDFKLVHIDKYADRNLKPSVQVPVFRCGWATRNTGNTTNVTISGAGASIETEGVYTVHGQPNGMCHTQPLNSGSTITNLLTLRNRMVFNDKTNRADIFLKDLSISTEASKTTTFYIYKNAETDSTFNFSYFNDTESLGETAINPCAITSLNPVSCFNTRTEIEKDLQDLLNELQPQESVTIAASFPSGQSADITAAISWEDDL